MTINDQIRDEKIQYDINREAAKKYQPYHQVKFVNMNILLVKIYYHLINSKIIEEAEFTYYPLGKGFEKQIKTIEDQGQKQVDALESLKTQEQTKAITYNDDDDDDDDNEFLKQKEQIYNILFDKKLDEIQELSKEIDYEKLNYNFTTKASGSIIFIKFKAAFSLFKKIRDGYISLKMAEDDQEKLKREFGQIKSGTPKHKSEMQLYTIKNVKNL